VPGELQFARHAHPCITERGRAETSEGDRQEAVGAFRQAVPIGGDNSSVIQNGGVGGNQVIVSIVIGIVDKRK